MLLQRNDDKKYSGKPTLVNNGKIPFYQKVKRLFELDFCIVKNFMSWEIVQVNIIIIDLCQQNLFLNSLAKYKFERCLINKL